MAPQSFSLVVVRSSDLLVLRLQFNQVEVQAPPPAAAGQIVGQANSTLVVSWQGQHIAEESFLTAEGQPLETPRMPGRVQARLAGGSRVAFTILPGMTIPYTLVGVLEAMQTLPVRVHPVTTFDRAKAGCQELLFNLFGATLAPQVSAPTPTQTALELPYRLILSPDDFARWHHATTPVTHNDTTELWHTRLGTKNANGDPRLRAIWSPDFSATALQDKNAPSQFPPFRYSPSSRQRNEIVHLSANFHLQQYTPPTLRTEWLMLSTLGGWVRAQGDWSPPPKQENGMVLEVEQWRQDTVGGRDQLVRVVTAGYLLPFGHRASLVELTERKFFPRADSEGGELVAYLLKREFVIVRQTDLTYYHRDMPFRSVTIQPTVTPDLNRIGAGIPNPAETGEAFWIKVQSAAGTPTPFRFRITTIDWEGITAQSTLPMVFVFKETNETLAKRQPVIAAYNAVDTDADPANNGYGTAAYSGQTVTYTPPHYANDGGDSTLTTTTLTFGAKENPSPFPQANFLPTMRRAEVQSRPLAALTGSNEPIPIEYEPTYLATNAGLGNNAQLFARVVAGGTPAVKFGADQAGGLLAPNFKISGISRAFGVVGNKTDTFKDGTYDPKELFKSLLDVQLLGAITLGDILGNFTFGNATGAGLRVPHLTTRRVGDRLIAEYTWRVERPDLRDILLFTPHAGAFLELKAITERTLDGTVASSRIEGKLVDFALTLIPGAPELKLIALNVTSVSFLAELGKKPDVAVVMGQIEFFGILQYVNVLSQLIPLDGFNDPPALDIVPPPDAGIKVGFGLGLPTAGIGIFTLQNIGFSAGLFLPFTDKPMTLRFAFCERWQPFILTVLGIGGGGFVGLELTLKGVSLIEAALEFGASVAINLGVASGQATIMGGVYFRKTGSGFELTAYIRVFGSLSVLGILTVSVELYVGLTFNSKEMRYPDRAVLFGQARVTVKIKLLFFSKSVSIEIEREIAGSDPTFRDVVSLPQWAEYCDAFDDYP